MTTSRTTSRALRALAVGALLLGATTCGVGSESPDEAGPTTTAAGDGAEGEAIDIEEVVEASRDETHLVVYGNPSAEQWAPVLAAFGERYPWIEVETFDLGGAEAFQRYLSEEATGSETADVIVNSDGGGWRDLIERGQVVDYVDPELADLPELAVAAPGVFTMSLDPQVAVFNTRALPLDEQPTSLAELAERAEELDGRIGTVEVENGQAGLATFGYIDAHGEEGWSVLEDLGPHTGVESSGGALLAKLTSGEYVASFMASGVMRTLIETTETGDVLNYRYFPDASVMASRGIAVTAAAAAPNAARLLVSFVLSEEGQTVMCEGGFTPYRDGVECPHTLASLEEEVGEENVVVIGYPEELVTEGEDFRARWNEAFGR